MQLKPWILTFDGSRSQKGIRVKITITSPNGKHFKSIFQLDYECSNNQAKYEALIIRLKILISMKASIIEVIRESQSVI